MNKPRTKSIISLAMLLLLLPSCSKKDLPNTQDPTMLPTAPPSINEVQETSPSYTNLVSDEEREELKAIMESASLDHIDEFLNWVQDYNKTMGDKTGLVNQWTPIDSRSQYDDGVMADKWDNSHDYEVDANCRLTVFLLMDQLIQSKGSEKYGSYIMMDVDEIESNDRYNSIRDKMSNYISVFDEVSVANAKTEEDFIQAFPNAWKNRGVEFPEGTASMISVVMNDPDGKVMFIGHTGVLIENGEELYFIEKLAPTMPYQVTKYSSRKQLQEELVDHRNYIAGDEEIKSFVLENNHLLEIDK